MDSSCSSSSSIASALSSDPTKPNITSVVSTKLDGTNYSAWRKQIEHVLAFEGLMSYVDGSVSAPPQISLAAISGSTISCLCELILNPDYVAWRRTDQHIISLLHATLHPSVLSDVVGCTTSKEVWDALAEMFACRSQLPESNKGVVLSALGALGLN
ncbi:hypothetical protein EJ110_NYTH08769 [Nymphaea thermarum]|nr:hypothetical protein EJ110_NYTH08769 [Nymphaea thermarum]